MEKLLAKNLDGIAKFIEESLEETLSYMDFPSEHWRKIRTNNGLERIMKEIRRRTRVVGSFPDGYSAMMLVGANFYDQMGNPSISRLQNGILVI